MVAQERGERGEPRTLERALHVTGVVILIGGSPMLYPVLLVLVVVLVVAALFAFWSQAKRRVQDRPGER